MSDDGISTSAYAAQYDALIERIQSARIADEPPLLVELVALAEANNDSAAAESAVLRQLRVADHLGDFDGEFSAFARLCAWYHAGRTHLRPKVLWYYKWIADKLPHYPALSREQIDAFYAQMEADFTAAGEGLRPLYSLRMGEAAFAGRAEDADAWHARWQSEPATAADDCPACQTQARVDALLDLARPEEALEAAAPILAGEQRCEEVPAVTFSRLLFPLLRAGDVQKAELAHRIGRHLVRRLPKLVRHLGDHVLYLTLLGRSDEARRLVALMLARGDRVTNGYTRYRVAVAAWLFATARKTLGDTDLPVPRRLSWSPPTGRVPLDALIARFKPEAISLAAQFDACNGTDSFAERIKSAHLMEAFLSKPRDA